MGKRGPRSWIERTTPKPAPARTLIVNNVSVIPPAHLQASTKRWFKSIAEEHQLEPHQMQTLQSAAECWDRYQQARKALAKHGLVYEDDNGRIFSRPEVNIERDARNSYHRAVRELGLRIASPDGGRR